MAFLGELRVKAQLENLRIVSHFIHGISQRLSLTDKTLFDLELAVEEAATNIINHAYPNDQKGDMVIQARQAGEFVQITLTDWGIPLNPANIKPFDIHAPVETRIKGGMGLHFIYKLMDDVERETSTETGHPNVLKLAKLIEKTQPGVRPPSAVQELNAMRTVSEVMTSNINLDDLLNLILNKLITTIGADRGTIFLVDEARQELWSRVLLEDVGPLSEIRVKIGEGIAGHVAQTGVVLNIPDAYADPRFNPQVDKMSGYRTRSMLTAPMINPQQKIIGVVQLLNKKDGLFNFRDERLVTAMTSQAAISIENARLYQQELQQQITNRELETAHTIQASFLPDVIPEVPGWDLAAIWLPIRSVAGDFYDFQWLDDGRLAVVIADVSGKGIPAALFMALSVTLLRFSMRFNLSPTEVTRRANESMLSDQRSRMFATTFVNYITVDTGEMEFSSGGHNPALVYRVESGTCETVTTEGVAVGIFKQAEYKAAATRLNPGDIFVLYTDGITEAINADEEEFGEERLQHILAEHAAEPAERIIEHILDAVTEFVGDMDLFDDATLVILKRKPV